MTDPNDPSPPSPRIDPATGQGAYATGLVVIHTRDEFLLDFIAGFAIPLRIVGRVVATPAFAKRMLRALMDNLGRYEKAFGVISVQPETTRAKAGQVQDLYGKLQIADTVLGGAYSNSMSVMHTHDEFIMYFSTTFPPAPKIAARLIVSPPHLRRLIGVLGDNLSQYEDRYGKIDDGAPPSEQRLGFSLN